ncbi:ABC transporter permease protein [unidentified eubacterium SCB49]|nr:ABC transporter permease protein [unidentified eubacterium SCB49]
MSLPVKIYERQQHHKIFSLIKESLKDMVDARFLAKQLAVRDIKAQYRQSYLGILWAFITPLATAVVWVILNISGTVNVTETGMPYPIFAFAGTLLWSIIVEAINAPMHTTNGARAIISKINIPKEALIISGIYKLLFNSSVKLVLLFVFLFVFSVELHYSVLAVPFLVLGAIFFGTTLGLFIAPFGVLYKDVGKIITFGFQFLMYATPVVYAIPKEGFLKDIMLLNPLTPLINTTREALVGFPITQLTYFFIVLAICVPFFFLGLVFYRISIPIIVERTS